MTRVFVTGGGGFMGHRILDFLLRDGHQVTALVHSTPPKQNGVTVVRGDIATAGEWTQAMQGCEVVIHCAAATGIDKTRADYRRLNVDGTRVVLDAAIAHGVKRVVNTSSVAVYGMAPGTYAESAPRSRNGHAYTDTKIEAEELIERAPIEWVHVRPAMIMGEGDHGFFPMALQFARAGKFPLFAKGHANTSFIDVDDLAELTVRCAFAPEAAGQAFNGCGPDVMTWRRFADRVTSHYKTKPAKSLPAAPLMFIGRLVDRLQRVGLAPDPSPIGEVTVQLMACDRRYPMDNARARLGFTPRYSSEQIIDRTFAAHSAL